MTITAKVIKNSIFSNKANVITFELTYPRFIHAEVMTHRVFSRNAASSRAIPVKKMLSNIWNNMAEPIHWGKNQSGMQAKEELKGFRKWMAQKIWRVSGKVAVGFAWTLDKLGAHKQIVNRIVEPWSHITIIMTTTSLENFFELRHHPDAQPEIYELAKQMKIALVQSIPQKLKNDEWHLPYVTPEEIQRYPLLTTLKISVARCARVSYLTHDGKVSNVEADKKLYDRLVGSVPLHASPAEHQAKCPATMQEENNYCGNLKGVVQFRKLLEEKISSNNTNSKLVSSIFDYK